MQRVLLYVELLIWIFLHKHRTHKDLFQGNSIWLNNQLKVEESFYFIVVCFLSYFHSQDRLEDFQIWENFSKFWELLQSFPFWYVHHKKGLWQYVNLQWLKKLLVWWEYWAQTSIQMPKTLLEQNWQHYYHLLFLRREFLHFPSVEVNIPFSLWQCFQVCELFHLPIDLPKLQIENHNNYCKLAKNIKYNKYCWVNEQFISTQILSW